MGNAVEVNSNVVNSNYAAILRNGLDVTNGNVDITQNLNVTGNLDVDGDTTLDITTIDGLLDINAGGQANTFKVEDLTSGRVVIAGTSGELEDSANLLFNGTDLSASSLIVSDLTSGRVVLAGGSGAVEDNANLKFNTTTSEFEVVGHTILDSLNVSGLSTFSSNINLADSVSVVFGTNGNASIKHTGSKFEIIETTSNFNIENHANNKDVNIRSDNGSGGVVNYFSADGSTGAATLFHYGNEKITTTSSGISVTGSAAVSGDLTVTGNVGIAGTLTYEDVSRVDAVGLSTFREGLFIPDNQKAQFGNAAGSADLNIYHSGSHSFIDDTGTGNLKIRSNNLRISNGDESKIYATFTPTAVDLFYDNDERLATTREGILVSGGTTTGTLSVTGVSTFTGSAFQVLSTGETLVKRTGGGGGAIPFIVSGDQNGQPLIEFRNGGIGIGNIKKIGTNGIRLTSDTLALRSRSGDEKYLEAVKDGAVELYYDNVKKLSTDIGGVQITGVTTSSGGFSGNLSGTATLATDLAINGTNQLLYQASNNDSAILPTGNSGQILSLIHI